MFGSSSFQQEVFLFDTKLRLFTLGFFHDFVAECSEIVSCWSGAISLVRFTENKNILMLAERIRAVENRLQINLA
jgi:hypothetical protein